MRVYIVRHGKAHDPSPEAPREEADFQRELSARGEAQAVFLAEQIAPAERRLRGVVSSRYPRALKTAQIIAPKLQQPVELSTDPRLEVDRPVSGALAIIEEHAAKKARAIMLVGHNPQLAELISVLVSGLPASALVLKTGELVAIDVRPSLLVGAGHMVQRVRMED